MAHYYKQLPSRKTLLAYFQINQAARHCRPLEIFTWRERPRRYFFSDHDWKVWNARYAGKSTGRLVRGYLELCIDGVFYYANRILYYLDTGVDPGVMEVDHKNGNLNNNSRRNLRLATHIQNNQNKNTQRNNTSGVKGVCWYKPRKYWVAQINLDGKHVNLGSFNTFEEAVAVRKAAEQKYFGEFNRRLTYADMLIS